MSNQILEKLSMPIDCVNLIDSKNSGNKYCKYLTNRMGRLYPTNAAICNLECKDRGPYNNRKISTDSEKKFIGSAWKKFSPMASKALMEKVLINYKLPVEITIPEQYADIKKELAWLNNYKGFRGIMLTGSSITKTARLPLKDLDIVLWFNDPQEYLDNDIYSKLPTSICGITTDYFVCIGNEDDIPNLYFACLDIDNKKLYASSWFNLKIVSMPDGFDVIQTEYKFVDEFLQELLTTSERKSINTKSLWKIVSSTWDKAGSFISSAKSRGYVDTVLDYVNVNNGGGNKVDEQIYQQRHISCFGDKKSPPCKMLQSSNNVNFCGACGCGATKLAILDRDGEGFSKLDYPYLACPLKKAGFSNAEIPLSIIIPVLNDQLEVNKTIQSIRDTVDMDVEIIVIDDASDIPVILDDKKAKLVRFDSRRGAGEARHYGATIAVSDKLLLLDSHMRFTKDWLHIALDNMENNKKTLWCGTCLGLNENNMDVNKPEGQYTGAELILYREKTNHIFDGVWSEPKNLNENYEISCVMGACYFVHKEWFFYIKGLECNKMWGCEEQFISIKTWLAGGDVRLMRDVKIGHKFRSVAPYRTPMSKVLYNKIRYMYLLLPDELYRCLLDKIPDDDAKTEALLAISADMVTIGVEKSYYKSIFIKDMNWLCEKFNISIPTH